MPLSQFRVLRWCNRERTAGAEYERQVDNLDPCLFAGRVEDVPSSTKLANKMHHARLLIAIVSYRRAGQEDENPGPRLVALAGAEGCRLTIFFLNLSPAPRSPRC